MSASAEKVVAALRRDSLEIELATADVLRQTASPHVYVFWFDAALGVVLADRIVAWSIAVEMRAGLMCVIEHGGGDDR